jgi:hypothetical protein
VIVARFFRTLYLLLQSDYCGCRFGNGQWPHSTS